MKIWRTLTQANPSVCCYIKHFACSSDTSQPLWLFFPTCFTTIQTETGGPIWFRVGHRPEWKQFIPDKRILSHAGGTVCSYNRNASLCCWLPGNKHAGGEKKGCLEPCALSRANHLAGYCCTNTWNVSDRLKLIHVVISESVADPPPQLLCGMVTNIAAKITLLHFR